MLPIPAPTNECICKFIDQLLQRNDREADRLLQHLVAIQHAFSFVPDAAVEALAERLRVARTQIRAAVSFYAFLHESPRGNFDIRFSDNITDRMLGNERIMRLLCERLDVAPAVPRNDGRVTVDRTSCTGMSDQGPALLVNGIALTRIDAERIDRIADLVETDTPLNHWPADYFRVDDNIRQPGLLLSDPGTATCALQVLVEHGANAVLERLEHAGLRGRGGAGFGTAHKWDLCRAAPGDRHFVVCNADEGEPGTFKDRVLLTSYADLVLEGMTLCARVIGARKGFIYLRGEYRYLLSHLESVLARRRATNFLGNDIIGEPGFDFDVEIHLGAGAYICGEESSLIESLEGKRGITRKRPPFPVSSGYRGQPTVVSNVETFAAAARIVERGTDWYRSQGTEQSSGSKILSVSGDIAYPGIYEVPFGTKLVEVLNDCGADRPQAVQVSGAAGETLSPADFERKLAFEDLTTAGSIMVFDRSRDMLEMVQNFAVFFQHESCGFCTPCRVGTTLLRDLVEKVATGQGSTQDLSEMRSISTLMRQASLCGLGHTAANHVLDTLDRFPEVYQRRLTGSDFSPSFDLVAALEDARAISGR